MRLSDRRQMFLLIVCVLVVMAGVLRAIHLRWISDDIFVGLRYTDNLIQGKGFVYNEGERVEGYSNFLWLMLILPFQWLGLDPLLVSKVMGVMFYAAIV